MCVRRRRDTTRLLFLFFFSFIWFWCFVSESTKWFLIFTYSLQLTRINYKSATVLANNLNKNNKKQCHIYKHKRLYKTFVTVSGRANFWSRTGNIVPRFQKQCLAFKLTTTQLTKQNKHAWPHAKKEK